MHRDDDSARPEEILLDRGFRPEHLTPRERQELAERLRREPDLVASTLPNGETRLPAQRRR